MNFICECAHLTQHIMMTWLFMVWLLSSRTARGPWTGSMIRIQNRWSLESRDKWTHHETRNLLGAIRESTDFIDTSECIPLELCDLCSQTETRYGHAAERKRRFEMEMEVTSLVSSMWCKKNDFNEMTFFLIHFVVKKIVERRRKKISREVVRRIKLKWTQKSKSARKQLLASTWKITFNWHQLKPAKLLSWFQPNPTLATLQATYNIIIS